MEKLPRKSLALQIITKRQPLETQEGALMSSPSLLLSFTEKPLRLNDKAPQFCRDMEKLLNH